MNNPDIRPDDWLPYRARQSFNLYELACLLHRQDPERLSSVISFEQIAHDRATGIPIDAGTPGRIAERINLLPEQMLGDAVGGMLATLKKATGASTVQRQVSIDEARRVTAALRLEWPAELDSPRALTQPTPSASASAVALPERVATPAEAVPVSGAGVVKHTTKTRRDPLAAVFARAKSEATDSTCPHSVWAALVAMATGNAAPPELTDYREDKGLQATGARGGWLSKSAFLDRWRRSSVQPR